MGITIWSSFAVPTILDYLQQLKRQGVEHVEIDDEARAVLRELYTRGSARKKPVATTAAAMGTTTTIMAATMVATRDTNMATNTAATMGTTKATTIKMVMNMSWPPL